MMEKYAGVIGSIGLQIHQPRANFAVGYFFSQNNILCFNRSRSHDENQSCDNRQQSFHFFSWVDLSGANLATFGQRNKPFCKYQHCKASHRFKRMKYSLRKGDKLAGIFRYLRIYSYLCVVFRAYADAHEKGD
jgi:hypothetical protein